MREQGTAKDCSNVHFRLGTVEDSKLITDMIMELAEYEKLLDATTTTESDIREAIANNDLETLLTYSGDELVGFAMFFQNYASLYGGKGMFLENIYIKPEYRGMGLGEATMKELFRIANERDYRKVDWHCLEWNPANKLYLKLNSTQKNDWIFYRIYGDELKAYGK